VQIVNMVTKHRFWRELDTPKRVKRLERVLRALVWLGFFDASVKVAVKQSLLETLCAYLEGRLRLEPADRDFIIM
jgi:hypothetical protein